MICTSIIDVTWYLFNSFDFMSLTITDIKHLYIHIHIVHLYCLFWGSFCCSSLPSIYLMGSGFFFPCKTLPVLHMSKFLILYQVSSWQIFFSSMRASFYLVIIYFAMQKLLSLMCFHLFIFASVRLANGIQSLYL